MAALLAGACSSSSPPDGPVVATAEVSIPGQPTAITHGDDALPPKPPSLAVGLAPEAGWPCEGTGTEGRRVQMVYAHQTGTLTASLRQSFEGIVRRIEGTFLTSAAKTGGERLVRFVTDASCNLSIIDLPITANAVASFDVLIREMVAAGMNRSDRIYHAWAPDYGSDCGIGTIFHDDSATNNVNEDYAQISRSNQRCWDYAEVHELIHNLGGVQDSAPHSTRALHCRDEADLMCYPDGGSNGSMIQPYPCPDLANEGRLDCGNDDYFAANPAPNGYLATHWNTANASALVRSVGSTTSSTAPPPTSSTSSTTSTTTVGTGKTSTDLSAPSSVKAGASFAVGVKVSGSCSPLGAVSIYVGGKLMTRPILSNGSASVTLTIGAGVNRPTIRADYEGSPSCAKSSDSVRVRVT